MSNSGPLSTPNGQSGEPDPATALTSGRTAQHLLGGGERTAAIYLGLVHIAFDQATNQLERGTEPAVIIGELMLRLGVVLEWGDRELGEAVRQAGYFLAERRIEAARGRRRSGLGR